MMPPNRNCRPILTTNTTTTSKAIGIFVSAIKLAPMISKKSACTDIWKPAL